MRRSLLLLLCFALGCSDSGAPEEEDDAIDVAALAQLEGARTRWRATGITSYAFTLERLCFCAVEGRGPVRMRVSGGAVVERTYVATGAAVVEPFAQWFPGVDGLFTVLEEAIKGRAHQVRVTYDGPTGVPVDIWIDYSVGIADEEQGFLVRSPVTPAP